MKGSLEENLNENMASGGGDGDEENPFSFKKFIKKSSRERTNSDSDWEDGSEDEEPALDLLDTSNHSKGNSLLPNLFSSVPICWSWPRTLHFNHSDQI